MNEDSHFFRNCVAASLLLHAALFLVLRGLRSNRIAPVEVDLTMAGFLGTGPAKLGAPKRLSPNAPAVRPLPAEEPIKTPDVTKPHVAPQPPKDWVTPGPETKKVEKPPEAPVTPGGAQDGTGTSPLAGGSGPGANYGTPGGTGDGGAALTKLPKLLNLEEVLANLRRFYPENERRRGNEGTVDVDIHIGVDGRVAAVDVKRSAGISFDNAAKQVALLMRFSPAENAGGPVPVKIAQQMVFKLKDQ